jgi:hypothetical protein
MRASGNAQARRIPGYYPLCANKAPKNKPWQKQALAKQALAKQALQKQTLGGPEGQRYRL